MLASEKEAFAKEACEERNVSETVAPVAEGRGRSAC